MKKSQKKVKKKKERNKLILIILAVLVISVIALGIFLISNICCGVKIGGLTDQQLRIEINKSFSEKNKVVIYPPTKLVEMTQEDNNWVGLGIKNFGTTAKTFSYAVVLSGVSGCSTGISKATAESWIATGRAEENMSIPSGDFVVKKVLLTIPKEAPLCTIRYSVNVKSDGTSYSTTFFDVKIKAK
jgi:hypothetical protein